MARIRTIKPDFWTDEKVVELSAFARLLFLGLLNFVDDEGRGEFRPKSLKMKILPADNIDIDPLFEELIQSGMLLAYSFEGNDYFQIKNFGKHQKIDKRRGSKFPPFTSDCADLRRLAPNPADGMEGNGMEVEREKNPSKSKSTEVVSFSRARGER